MGSVGKSSAQGAYDPLELIHFLSDGFNPMNEMFERARASELAIYERTKAVMEYFNMPFDVPPPE